MAEYPQEMIRPSSGHTEICYSRADEVELRARGFERLHEQVEFQAFPMWLEGDGLPPLLVEGPDQAKEAAHRGYRLPDDAEVAASREAFSAAHAPPVEDAYVPQRYPMTMRHPLHRDAVPVRWTYDIDGAGTAIPGSPEEYPDVVVDSPGSEAEWRARGWSAPAPPADEPDSPHAGVDDAEYLEFLAWKRSQAQPRRKKMSGAARRKLALQRGEQHA
jgi:hypothetical protein